MLIGNDNSEQLSANFLINILDFLDARTLTNATQVNKTWHLICENKIFKNLIDDMAYNYVTKYCKDENYSTLIEKSPQHNWTKIASKIYEKLNSKSNIISIPILNSDASINIPTTTISRAPSLLVDSRRPAIRGKKMGK
jgi:hypothetical protein